MASGRGIAWRDCVALDGQQLSLSRLLVTSFWHP